MNELGKLALASGELRKRANLLDAQLADLDRRLGRLERYEDWPSFCEATVLALPVANYHSAPSPWRLQ